MGARRTVRFHEAARDADGVTLNNFTRLMKVCTHHDFMAIHNHLGHLLVKQPLPQVINGAKAYNGRRGDIHRVLLEYAIKLGVDIRLGQEVEEYWETDSKAGVIIDGIRLEGDVVVAADGIRSIAREKALVKFELKKLRVLKVAD